MRRGTLRDRLAAWWRRHVAMSDPYGSLSTLDYRDGVGRFSGEDTADILAALVERRWRPRGEHSNK